MKRKLIVFITCFIFLVEAMWAQVGGSRYQAELVGRVPDSAEPGGLGSWVGPGAAMFPGQPVVYGDRIYIMDNCHGWVNIYDKNFVFQRVVSLFNPAITLGWSSFISPTPDGGLIVISSGITVRVDATGKVIYAQGGLPSHVSIGGQFWGYKDYLIFYDSWESSQYQIINGQGDYLGSEEIRLLGIEMRNGSRLRNESPRLRKAIDDFLDERNLLFAGENDYLYTWHSDVYLAFYNIIRENSAIPVRNRVPDAEFDIMAGGGGGVGNFASDDGALVWTLTNIKLGKEFRYLFSYRGEVLDFFTLPEKPWAQTYAADGNFYGVNEETYNGKLVWSLYRAVRK